MGNNQKCTNSKFCIVPFIHLSTSPLGSLRPCCFSSQYKVSNEKGQAFNLGRDPLQKIWTSGSYQNIRDQFIKDRPPKECQACFDEEAMGKKSKRLKENEAYKHLKDEVILAHTQDHTKLSGPKTLDLRLGNLCNLKCLSCNPIFSSPIEKEMRTKWPESYFEKESYAHVNYDNTWFESELFQRNIESIIDDLEFIYVSGGEPTINPALIKFMKMAVSRKRSFEQELRFNTNLMSYQEEFYGLLPHFKKVDISISLDAIGEDLHLIRYPLQFDIIKTNIEKLLKIEGQIEITFNCTTSLLNIFSLKDFYLWVKELSTKHKRYFHVAIDLVHEPTYLSLRYLRPDLKKEAIQEIEDIVKEVRLKEAAKNDLLSLIELINRPQANDYIHQLGQRAQFMETMNKMRNLHIEKLKGMSIE